MSTTTAVHPATAVPDAPCGDVIRRENIVLACICACTALVISLVAAINLAVPMLASSSLNPTSSQLLWIVDGYVVVFACLVIPAGAAGDRYGRKGLLMAGLVTLAVGSAISGFAGNVPVMLAGRVITGAGAALVLPNGLAVLMNAVAPARKGRAIAIWAGASGLGGVLGNVGGGALLSSGSWRTLFLTASPLALVLAAWVAKSTRTSPRNDRAVDPIGSVLLVATTVALLLAIINGPEHGWTSTQVLVPAIAAVILAGLWVFAGLNSKSPVLDPRLFKIGALATACLGMLVAFFGNFGLFYINASLMQYGRGFSVLETGLAILPLSIPMIVGTRFVPQLTAKIGAMFVLAAAFITAAIGLFGLALTVHQPYAVYAIFMVVVGIGITLALPCLTAEITASLPASQAGVAGGLQSATREFGSALGVAIVGTILTTSFTKHLPTHIHGAPRTVAEALHAAPQQHKGIVDAFVTGSASALEAAAAVVLVVGAIIVFVMKRSREATMA